MADGASAEQQESTRQNASLIAGFLADAAAKPRQATNGVPATTAVLTQLILRGGVPLLVAGALTALTWRLARRRALGRALHQTDLRGAGMA